MNGLTVIIVSFYYYFFVIFIYLLVLFVCCCLFVYLFIYLFIICNLLTCLFTELVAVDSGSALCLNHACNDVLDATNIRYFKKQHDDLLDECFHQQRPFILYTLGF